VSGSLRPWLWLSPAFAHKISPVLLHALRVGPTLTPPEWQPFTWRGLHFPNRLGIAGGVDKDGRNIREWCTLGAGFLEVGTITPKPQPGNPPPVVDRDIRHEAIWNRLGFPSHGVDKVARRLSHLPRPFYCPLFANIGKNATTSLHDAHKDYLQLIQQLQNLVDGFVINISSPNTQGLRELLKPENLKKFLEPLLSYPNLNKPVLLKLSPDMSAEELGQALDISHDLGVSGWILTNTSQHLRENLSFPTEGGVSGRPLATRSKEALVQAIAHLGPRRQGKLLVSVGGVLSLDDIKERLTLGADLVQVYTALVLSGPWFMRKVSRCLRRTM